MQGIAGVGFLHVDLPVIHEFFSWLGLMLPSLRLRQLTPIFLLCASSIFALATFVYLRSKEDEGDDGTYLTWAEALEWHLAIALRNPCEDDALRDRTCWRELRPCPLLLPELPSFCF